MSTVTELTAAECWDRVFAYDGTDHDRWILATILGLTGNPTTPKRLYAIIRHVSQSGMLRLIDLYATRGEDLALIRPKWTDLKQDKRRDGYRMTGCGMDMTFALANHLFEEAKRVLGIAYHEWPYQDHQPPVTVL